MAIRDLFFSIVAKDKTGQAFASVKRNMRDIDGAAASIGQKMDRVGTRFTRAGGAMSFALAPAGLGLLSMVRTAGDFEASMNRVAAVSGATGDAFEALKAKAADLGSTTVFSASEAADGMSFLAMAGFETNEILAAMPGVLNLAAAANMDLATSADIVSNVLTGYGRTAEETAAVNDVLVATMTGSNTDLRQLGDAFKYAGPLAKSAGVEFELTAAILGRLGDAGIQGEMGGTALRGAITRLLAPTKGVNAALETLGVNLYDATGAMIPFEDVLVQLAPHAHRSAEMMEIFGQRAGPAMISLLAQGTDGIFEFRDALREAGGTAEEVATRQMQGFNGQLKALRSAFEGLAIAIGESGLLETLTDVVEGITYAVRVLSESNPKILKFGTVFVGLAAAIAPVVAVAGLFVTAIAAISAPVLLAVSAVTAITSALVAFWPEIRAGIQWVGDFASAVHDGFMEVAAPAIDHFTGLASESVSAFGALLRGDFTGALEHGANAADEYFGLMLYPLELFRDGALEALEAVGVNTDLLVERVNFFRDQMAAAFVFVRDIVIETVGEVVVFMTEKFSQAFDLVVEKVGVVKDAFFDLYDAVVGNSYVPDLVDEVGDHFARLDAEMVDPAIRQTSEVGEAFRGLGEGAGDVFRGITRDGKVGFSSLKDALLRQGQQLRDSLLSQVFAPIQDAVSQSLSGLGGASGGGPGGGLVGGLANIATSAATSLFSGLLGFNDGGEMLVGGRGGVDRNIAAFRVSQGERIKVTKRGESGGGSPVTVHIHTRDAASFEQSRGQVAATIARAVGRGHRNL